MPERLKQVPDEFWNWIVKILIPCLAALTISVAIQMKNKTAKLSTVFLSVIIGIMSAYLSGGFIIKHFSADISPIMIGIVTIGGEKIGFWLIYKFDFAPIGEAIVKYLKKKIK